MTEAQATHQSWQYLIIQFIKLQLAGNILFWGTYLGYPLFHEVLGWPRLQALVTASIIANILYFIVDKRWIFVGETGRRKTTREIIRFFIFMTLNFFINLLIIESLARYLGITPYIGQFIAGLFFTIWTYVGLKFWVFEEPRIYGLTWENLKKKYHDAFR